HTRHRDPFAVDVPVARVVEVLHVHAVGGVGHVVLPDGRGDPATVDEAVELSVDRGVLHRLGALGVADPHRGGHLRHVPDEPGRGVVVGGTGLARYRPVVQHRLLAAHARGGHVVQRIVHRVRDVLVEHPFAVRVRDLELLTVGGGDGVERDRRAVDAAGGVGGERLGHGQRGDLVGTERHRGHDLHRVVTVGLVAVGVGVRLARVHSGVVVAHRLHTVGD